MEEPLHLPDAPIPPEDGDCCGNGCEVCVHDMYATELAEYRRLLMEYETRQTMQLQPAPPTEES